MLKFGFAVSKGFLNNRFRFPYYRDNNLITFIRSTEKKVVEICDDNSDCLIKVLTVKQFEKSYDEVVEPFLLCSQKYVTPPFVFIQDVIYQFTNGVFVNCYGDTPWKKEFAVISNGIGKDTKRLFDKHLCIVSEIFNFIDEREIETYKKEYELQLDASKFGI